MTYRFIGVALFGAYLSHVMAYNFLNDDAYISFRYALNLAEHGELTYNLGERVEGYTNFLWTVLMAGVLFIGAEVETWSRILSVIFGAGTLAIVGFHFHRKGSGPLPTVISVGLLAAAPAFACWSTGGLETMMFTFFLTLGWLALLSEWDEDRAIRSCAYFAIAAMVRPEGILAFGLGIILLTGQWFLSGRSRHGLKRLFIGGGWFALLYGPYFGWRVWYYGWLFPNTYYVKTGATGLWAPGMNYVWDWVMTHGLLVLPICLLFSFAKNRQQSAWVKVCGILFLGAFMLHVAKIGGDFMALHRFLVPLLPICAVTITLGILAMLEKPFAKGLPAWSSWVLAVVCFYGSIGYAKSVNQEAMTVGSENGVDSIGWLKMFAGQCRTAGIWLGENMPEGTSIATTAAGTIPFYSRLYTVDILGLNDEWIAHEVPATGSRPGHTRVAPESYLASKSVDVLIYHPQFMESARKFGPKHLRASNGARTSYVWRIEKVRDLKPPYFGFWERPTESPKN